LIVSLSLSSLGSAHDAKPFVESCALASNVEVQHGRTGVTYFFMKDPSGILVEVWRGRGRPERAGGAAVSLAALSQSVQNRVARVEKQEPGVVGRAGR
jgi:hypothetical protein